MFKHLPDGRMLAWSKHSQGNLILIEPESGEIEIIPLTIRELKMNPRTGHMWYNEYTRDPVTSEVKKTDLWGIDLPYGTPSHLMSYPATMPGYPTDITCDGRYLILLEANQDLTEYPIPTTKDVKAINHYFSRPRSGALHVMDITTGNIRKIYSHDTLCPLHIDTSPVDPTLIRFALDMPDSHGQRVWTIRVDGSNLRLIRPQAYGELVTHEFWWADPNFIGYTYQDRRKDPTLATHHWAEYTQAHSRLGISNLMGQEVYCSDPLNSYHSHLYRSNDGSYVCGEGTHDNSFVQAAPFSMKNTRIDFRKLATIHTTYIPFRGQGVECNFSADNKWLLYNDKPNNSKVYQIFAVKIDF